MWPRGDLATLKVSRECLAGAERTGNWCWSPEKQFGESCTPLQERLGTHFGARPCPHFGARLRVESLRTALRFEEALELRVKLITENGNVCPFTLSLLGGRQRLSRGYSKSRARREQSLNPCTGGGAGKERGDGRWERKRVWWQKRTLGDAPSLCVSTKVLSKGA